MMFRFAANTEPKSKHFTQNNDSFLDLCRRLSELEVCPNGRDQRFNAGMV